MTAVLGLGEEKRREVPPLRNPTISQEVRWEEKIGLLRSG